MPFVVALNVPGMNDDQINGFATDMKSAVCGVAELGLRGEEDAVTVILIPGMVARGTQREILIETSGLRDDPERTLAVRKRVAVVTGQIGDRHFPDSYVASRVADPYDYDTMPFWDNEE